MSERQQKVAIVTGAARGIGRATAYEFAQQGFAAVVADLDATLAEQVAKEFQAEGLTASAIGVDVANRQSVAQLVETTLATYGRVDVLVNNAGIAGRSASLLEITDDDWEKMMAIDLKSVYLCCQAVLPNMLERGSGAIVNVASIAGKEGNPNAIPYSTAKAGVIGLTKALAKEVATKGIRVNAVAPAVIETEILKQISEEHIKYMTSRIPMGRLGQPYEVAKVIGFLASDGASFVTGQCYDVSGGRATY